MAGDQLMLVCPAGQVAVFADMHRGEQVFVAQGLMNRRRQVAVCRGHGTRFDVGDEVWLVVIACLRQMHFVAHPHRCVLLPVMRIDIVRGTEKERRRGTPSCSVRQRRVSSTMTYC